MTDHIIEPGEDRDQEIADLYNSGMPIVDIAKRIGWSVNRVGRRVNACRKYGLVSTLSTRQIVEMRNAEIEVYLVAKKSEEEIARLMNLDLDQTRRIVSRIRSDIRRRKRREERLITSSGGCGK
ncbi:MAG TPA: winged helix-turn-helix transcriptional regulator [Methanomassiliicoccaceae archaeon]|nr:winged helix-turn-helix transcriptional regulator [Methanomassiliicoccaceae archaeon]